MNKPTVTDLEVANLTYHEQWEFFGLPDVRDYVAQRQATEAWAELNTTINAFGDMIRELGTAIRGELDQLAETIVAAQPLDQGTRP